MHGLETTVLAYRLPKGSKVEVSVGQEVREGDCLAKTLVSKETLSFPLSSILHVSPKKVSWCLIKKPGEDIKKGDLVAFKKGFLGLFSKKFHSTIDGKIDRLDGESGDLFIKLDPTEVPFLSDVTGRVSEVEEDLVSVEFKAHEIDSDSFYKGKKVGKLELITISAEHDSLDCLEASQSGKILAVDGEVGRDFLFKASALGVSALIVSEGHKGIVDGDLFDKKIKVNSKEVVISMPVFLVSGDELKIKSTIWEAFESHKGRSVILDGDNGKILMPSQ